MTRLDLLGALGGAGRPGGQLGPGAIGRCAGCWRRRWASPRGESCRGWRRGVSCAARPAAGLPALRAAAARKCSTSSTSTPTISIRNWPRPWWPCWSTTASRVYVHPEQKQAGMAVDRLRRAGPCPAAGRAQRRHPGRSRAAGLSRRGHRAGRRAVPDARISAVARRRRRPAGGRQQQRGLQLPLENAHARAIAARFQAVEPRPWAIIRPATCGPCGVGSPGENLLGLIPGLRLHHIESGCSGMAGTFGLLHKNYRSSLRAGWRLISRLRDPASRPASPSAAPARFRWNKAPPSPRSTPSSSWPSPTA